MSVISSRHSTQWNRIDVINCLLRLLCQFKSRGTTYEHCEDIRNDMCLVRWTILCVKISLNFSISSSRHFSILATPYRKEVYRTVLLVLSTSSLVSERVRDASCYNRNDESPTRHFRREIYMTLLLSSPGFNKMICAFLHTHSQQLCGTL